MENKLRRALGMVTQENSPNTYSLIAHFVAMLIACCCLISCVTLPGGTPGQSSLVSGDEAAAMNALEAHKNRHDYIEFDQSFPETYLYKMNRSTVWGEVLNVLRKSNENFSLINEKEGIIVTFPKALALDATDRRDTAVGRLAYKQRIVLQSAGPAQTRVSDHVSFYKNNRSGQHATPIQLSRPENVIRGIFFGSLTAALYPKKVNESNHINQTKDGEIVHIVRSDDTLGEIAKKYTGNVMNYKTIAEYNSIKKPNNLKVGQKIRIPRNLLFH